MNNIFVLMKSPDCEDILDSDDFEIRAAYIWFKVKQTQVEMIRDRGLKIPEDENFLLEYDSSKEKLKDWEYKTLNFFVMKYRDIATGDGINFNSALSRAYLDEKTGITTVVIYLCRRTDSSIITTAELTSKFEFYREKYYKDGPLNMVFISEVDLNKNEEKIDCLNYIKCQFFLTRELLINPTKFRFYYPHSLLNEEERRQELLDNNIRPDQLPIILKTDPIVKYFNWDTGGIIRIDRTERTLEVPAPKSYYLRVIK